MNDPNPKYTSPNPAQGYYQGPPVMAPPQHTAPPPPPPRSQPGTLKITKRETQRSVIPIEEFLVPLRLVLQLLLSTPSICCSFLSILSHITSHITYPQKDKIS
ncbi:unnamed protein product [Camellia sinensis]